MSPAKRQSAALKAAVAALATMPIARLRAQYEHAFKKPAGTTNRDHMVRALAERATGTAQDAAIATTKPSAPTPTREPNSPRKPASAKHDPRLPAPGGTIERVFKGKALKVEVTADGFRHAGKAWSSLTALALSITGYGAISGPAFFGLSKPRTAPPAKPPTATAPRRGRSKGD